MWEGLLETAAPAFLRQEYALQVHKTYYRAGSPEGRLWLAAAYKGSRRIHLQQG
jgi:hypothetical protein